jgi:twitching motility protein PilT
MTTFTIDEKNAVPTLTELGHPGEVSYLSNLAVGVILISGRHGSGKSTTLAALAKEVRTQTDRLVVEVGASEENTLGLPYFKVAERQYAKVTKSSRDQDVEAARRYALLETAELLKAGVEVAVFDDIRHVEAALIASYLAGAGVLVLASIHNTGEPQTAISNFVALPGRLSAPLDPSIVHAVVQQSLSRDGDTAVLTSSVYRP